MSAPPLQLMPSAERASAQPQVNEYDASPPYLDTVAVLPGPSHTLGTAEKAWLAAAYTPDLIVSTVRPDGTTVYLVVEVKYTNESSLSRTAIAPRRVTPHVRTRAFLEQQLRDGRIRGIPRPLPRARESEDALRALTRMFPRGMSAEKIVREDRGPLFP